MKKKIFLMVAAILALCLTCGMLLVACNPDKPNPTPPPTDAQESWSESVTTMNKELSQKLKDNQQFNPNGGRKFVADFELELAIDDKTEANADASYKLIGKANISVDSFDTQFYLAITENKEGYTTPKTLFGLGYDDDATNPYFYFNINDGGYKKINAFSLHQLMLDLDAKEGNKSSEAVSSALGWDEIKKVFEGILADPSSIFDLLSTMELIKTNGTRANYGNSFIYEFNLPAIINAVSSVVNDKLITDNLGQEGLTQIMGVIKKIPVFANCSSIADVWKSIGEYIQFTKLSYRIDFAENSNEIIGMGFTVNYINYLNEESSQPTPIGDYTLSLNKLRIDQGTPIADIFAGTGIDEVADDAAINILKFSIDGVAIGMKNVAGEGATPSYEENHRFTISVDADLNPFALMELVGRDRGEGADTNIANAIKKLGYLHIEINEVNAENEIVKNILLIHTKTEEGYIIAQFYGLKSSDSSTDTAIGGVYNIQELVEYIGVLSRQKSASAAADVDFNKILEIAKKVIGYVKDIWAMVDVDFKNIASEGVTLEISNLLDYIVTKLNVPSGSLIDPANIIRGLAGDSDLINIKVSDAKYGVCDTVETSTVKGFVYTGTTGNLANQIKEGQTIIYDETNPVKFKFDCNGYGMNMLKFVGLDGKEFEWVAHLYYVDYDPSIVGEPQTVTAYFGVGTFLTYTIALAPDQAGSIIKYPLSGIMSAQFQVTIPAPAAA